MGSRSDRREPLDSPTRSRSCSTHCHAWAWRLSGITPDASGRLHTASFIEVSAEFPNETRVKPGRRKPITSNEEHLLSRQVGDRVLPEVEFGASRLGRPTADSGVIV